ncbi:hypothetical protein ACFL2R_00570, partial [Patescibacteria group bacterium]
MTGKRIYNLYAVLKRIINEYPYVMMGLVVFVLFLDVVFSKGIVLGGDWGIPMTKIQLEVFFSEWRNTWTNVGNLFGLRQISLTSLVFKFLGRIFFELGLSGVEFVKFFILLFFFCAGSSMISLLRYLRISKGVALIGGTVYVTMPIFFDYLLMGWQFVVVVFAILPLVTKYFIKAVRSGNAKYSIIVGILYSLSMIQSQSMIWFPMLFLVLATYLIEGKKSILNYVKSVGIIFTVFVLLNLYWALSLLLIPDQLISSSDIVNSSVSLGTMGHFYPVNIIRLFGGLFNFQYETEMQKTWLGTLSFVLPFLALGSLYVKKYKKEVLVFWLIGLIPFLMYLLNFHREILLYIPFSNVVRDFARFTIFSTFAYAVLIGIFLNHLLLHRKIEFRRIGVGCIILWLVAIFPWWTGGVTNWKDGIGSDIRIRTKVFSGEYYEIEGNFYNKKLDQKAFYLPYGGTVDIEDDVRFHGMFKETQDIFAMFSPVNGVLGLSDRNYGYIDDFLSVVVKNELIESTKLSNIGYLVVRKNMLMRDRDEFIGAMDKKMGVNEFGRYFERGSLVVFNRKEFLPHFYTPVKNIISSGTIDELIDIVSSEKYETRSAVFFKYQNKENLSKLNSLGEKVNGNQIIEFRKINPTKYRLRIHNATEDFPLVFSESFHEQWKAYVVKYKESEVNSEQLGKYKILDGNENDQITKDGLEEFIEKGWVTDLGNGNEKESKHYRWNGKKEVVDHIERYDIDFVSKNFNGTIQNDNLPKGYIWETWRNNEWLKQISDKNHLMVNGYANSWKIDVDELCSNEKMCYRNDDGSYDMEIIVEFWPQRLFYIGLLISGVTLLGCLGYL